MKKTLGLVVIAVMMMQGCTWREAGSTTVGALAAFGGSLIGAGDSGANSVAAGMAGNDLGDWLFSESSRTPETKLHPEGYVEPEKVIVEKERLN